MKRVVKVGSAMLNAMVVVGMLLVGWAHASNAHEKNIVNTHELTCIALNIYFETSARSLIDSMTVTDVVLNRVQDTRYPDNICDVVTQGLKNEDGSMKRNLCQFSWYCDGKSDEPKDQAAWQRSINYAYQMLAYGNYRGLTEGATHYHAHYVNPSWNKDYGMNYIGSFGVHKFYRSEQ